MKAVVTQGNFSKALNYVSKAISTNPSIPILANVLIEFTKDQVKLSTTDLEIGINTLVGADVKNEGKITVDAKTLAEYVNSLPKGTLTLSLEDRIFKVGNDHSSSDFNTIGAEEFPPLPEVGDKPIFSVKSQSFTRSVNQVVFSSASDDSRPVLTGVLFELTKNKLSMIGVDGFRLSKKVTDIVREGEKDTTYIVPARALNELARIVHDLTSEEDLIEVYLIGEKNQMLFTVKDLELSTRLIEGEFPDYKQILPKEYKYSFGVSKNAFAQIVKVVSIFARSSVGSKAVFYYLPSKSMLQLSAQVADVGGNESSVEVQDIEGDELKTAYNTKFVMDMINSMKGDEIVFESNGVTAPGVFKDKDDPDFLHIIMPMRLD